MTGLIQRKLLMIMLSLACLLLAACGTTQPSRFYMLNGISETTIESPGNQEKSNVHIGVGPVSVPKYLDRYPIVKRSAGSEVIIDDVHRWAEPLVDNFTRILASNLYILVGAEDTSIHPWQNHSQIDYQVVVDVLRFDADVNNNIVLIAHWTIYGKADKEPLYKQKSTIVEKADKNDYATIVNAHSTATKKLSEEIAEKLKEIIA